MISSWKRLCSFIPAAPRIVRIERAVRPCLPITLPKSFGATRSSSTIVSPSTSVTLTCSGSSTSDLAICSTKARMSTPGSPVMDAPLNRGRGYHDGWLCRCACRRRLLGHELAHPLAEPGALGDPVLNTLALQVEAGGTGARIVRPHHLHRAPVARPLLLDHHHP